jgi:short-subunit dehydrogenase
MSRVAFITGASSGLGAGLATRLAADGWRVGLAARRVDRLESVAAGIDGGGGKAVVCPCDVADRADVLAAVEKTERELGPVELLVANAGMSIMTHVKAFDSGGVEQVLRVNFLGAVYAVEATLPGMLELQSGQLVAMGSIAGYGGLPKTAAYSASKGAMHNFFESLSVDLRGTGVDVTIITPGYIRTELTDKNRHHMPYLVELDPAVERIAEAIARREKHLAFPRPLSTAAWLAQMLPARAYQALAAKVKRKKAE